MSVIIGEVETFPNVQPDKEQMMKISEEHNEVYHAWENYRASGNFLDRADLVDECADLIQAICNMLAAIGVHNMRPAVMRCEGRNRKRGRFDAGIQ